MLAGAAIAGTFGVSAANATPVPSVAYSYTTYVTPGGVASPVTTYVASVGTPLTLPVYLFEDLTGGASSIINGDGGLFGGGFSVKQTSLTGILTGIADSVSGNGSSFAGGNSKASPSDTSSFEAINENVAAQCVCGP